MTPEDVKAWRGYRTQAAAGASIGRSERQIRDYEAGRAPIDLTIELACAAQAAGITSYKRPVDAGADTV